MTEPIIDGVPAGSLPGNTVPLSDTPAAPAVNADADQVGEPVGVSSLGQSDTASRSIRSRARLRE